MDATNSRREVGPSFRLKLHAALLFWTTIVLVAAFLGN
jgi:hypothetical protein